MNLNILYEDKDIIVIVKPRGLLSQGDEKGSKNAAEILSAITGSEIFVVQRLDKGTGGVMVYAKNSKAASFLSRQIAENKTEKLYLAKVKGIIHEKQGTMEDMLFFDRRKNKSYVVKRERKGVKKALLSYKVIDEAADISLVEIKLHTGRTHQIRVQFASRGYPLLGDRRYGAKDGEKELSLFAYSLTFSHPSTGERMTFKSGEIPF